MKPKRKCFGDGGRALVTRLMLSSRSDFSLLVDYICYYKSRLFDTLDRTPKSQETKVKTYKWNYVKLQNFYTTINRTEKQPTEKEKIGANGTFNKSLTFRT